MQPALPTQPDRTPAQQHSPARTHEESSGRLDGEIIHALQIDGRASVNELASTLGVSRDFVAHRIRVLSEQSGLRIVAALDPSFAGHHVLIHCTVAVTGPASPIAARIAELPDAVFVSLVSGQHPIVFESRHGDIAELHRTLGRVRDIPGVRNVKVTTYAEVLQGFFMSQQKTQIPLDDIDFKLIANLQRDGRATFRTLAEAVRLSPSATRSRVNRLIDSGVIRISAIRAGGISRNRIAMGFGIAASGDTDVIAHHLIGLPGLDFAAHTHGSFDFIGTLVGPASANLITVLDRIRALPEVDRIESWAHFEVVKEDYTRTLGPVI